MSDSEKPAGTFSDYSETNPDAQEHPSTYDICDRSGFRAKRGELVEQWDGLWVLPEFIESRHPQDLLRARGERHTAQLSPEPEDEFLSTNQVSTEDL